MLANSDCDSLSALTRIDGCCEKEETGAKSNPRSPLVYKRERGREAEEFSFDGAPLAARPCATDPIWQRANAAVPSCSKKAARKEKKTQKLRQYTEEHDSDRVQSPS